MSNPRDSNNTQALKYSNYIKNRTRKTILEGQVKNFRYLSATPTSITVTYSKVGNPIQITFTLINTNDYNEIHEFTTTQSPFEFTELNGNTTYNIIAVSSYVSNNKYTVSFDNAISTLNESPATNIFMSKIQNTSATLNFTKPIGNIKNIDLTVINTNDSTDTQFFDTINTPFIIPNLQINNNYSIQIISNYLTGNKYVSYLKTPFTTLNEDLPFNIKIFEITSSTAIITYDYIGKAIKNTITVQNINDSKDIYTKNTLDKRTEWQLKIYQIYQLTIQIIYDTGNIFDYTHYETFQTLNEGKVSNIQILNITGDSIFFSFTSSIGNPLYYKVLVENPGNKTENYLLDLSANNTNRISINNLESNTNYILNINSIYDTGNSFNNSLSFSTLNESVINSIEIIDINNTSIFIDISDSVVNNSVNYFIFTKNNTNQILTNTKQKERIGIYGLSIYQTYTITVISIYSNTQNKYTYEFPGTITTLNEGPSTILSINNITINSMDISFNNIYGSPIEYKIFLQDINKNITSRNIIPSQGTITGAYYSINIPGLSSNMKYDIIIQTFYYDDKNPYPTQYDVSFNNVFTKMTPKIKDYKYVTFNSISILFDTPLYLPKKLEIVTIEDDIYRDIYTYNDPTQISSLNGISNILLNDLNENKEYILKLRFYYSDSYIESSENFIIATKGNVRNLNINKITNESSILQFSPPFVLPDYSYNINILDNKTSKSIESFEIGKFIGINTRDISYNILSLIPNTKYTVIIITNYNNDISYSTSINWSTKDIPRNINITNVTDISAVITFNPLLYIPDYYKLYYNNTNIRIPGSDISLNASNQFEYHWSGLEYDYSYNNIRLESNYNDILDNYSSTVYTETIYTKGYPIDVCFNNITTNSARFLFTKPNYTNPDSYIIYLQNTNSKLSIVDTINSNENNNYYYNFIDLSENTNYNIQVFSVYNSNQSSYSSKTKYQLQTYGYVSNLTINTIYDTYITFSWTPLIVVPDKYRIIFSSKNIDISYSFTTIDSSYSLPEILSINNSYNVSIVSRYSEVEYISTYPEIITTKGYPKIYSESILTNDVSCNISFTIPDNFNPSDGDKILYQLFNSVDNGTTYELIQTDKNTIVGRYNDYTISEYTNTSTGTNDYSYFQVNELTENSLYQIILYSYYNNIDTALSNSTLSIKTFNTDGPPTSLQIIQTTNTQVTLSFIAPYNCSNYIFYATNISSNIEDIQLFKNASGGGTITHTITDLQENVSYSIYVKSNYINTNNFLPSNTVYTKTYRGLYINDIINITDVSLTSVVSILNPNMNNISYILTTDTGNIPGSISLQNIPRDDNNNYLIPITGLTPNTNYTNFVIKATYLGSSFGNGVTNGIELISNNETFYTIGLDSSFNNYITDISAIIYFSYNPNIINVNYYYDFSYSSTRYNPTTSSKVANTFSYNNNINYFNISNFEDNTKYSLYIFTDYGENGNRYAKISKLRSNKIEFTTKQYPKILNTAVIYDNRVDISFTTILARPIFYTYSIQSVYGTLQTIPLNNIRINNNNNRTISSISIDLSANTYYSIFKINAYYSDISITYSSTNISFITYSSPLQTVIKNNILYFYPPINPPDYYILTYDGDTKLPIYSYDLSYSRNQYSYSFSNNIPFNKYSTIQLQSYYNNQTIISTNFQKISHSVINNLDLLDIATNSTGQYIAVCGNKSIYISNNYGNNWTSLLFNNIDSNIDIIRMNDSGQYIVAISKNSYYYFISNNYGSNFILLNTINNNLFILSASINSTGNSIFIGGKQIGLLNSFNLFSNNYGESFQTDNTNNNSIYSVQSNSFIYSIDSNIIYKINPNDYNNRTTLSLPISFVPSFISVNQSNNRFIVLGYDNNNAQIYISKDGDNWKESILSNNSYSNLSWKSLSSDMNGILAVLVLDSVGVFITNDAGNNWSALIPNNTQIINAVISKNSKYIYAYDNQKNLYSYRIPDVQTSVTNLSVSNVTNTSVLLSGFPPSYLPDLSYSIHVENTILPYDVLDISSNTITDVSINPLNTDGSYNFYVTSHYLYPFQDISSLIFSSYTKSDPSNVIISGNPSDTSAVIQFTPPKIYPDKFILDAVSSAGNIRLDISGTDIYTVSPSLKSYTLTELPQNQYYSVYLSAHYNDISTAYISSTHADFNTRGYPSNITFSNITESTANISFNQPLNVNDISSIPYTISVTNQKDSSTITYNSNPLIEEEYILRELFNNSVYSVRIITNYTNPVQYISSLYQLLYTKSAPLDLSVNPIDITETTAILQFTSPVLIPDYYELDVSKNVTIIPLNSVYTYRSSIKDISAITIDNLIPNTTYTSNIFLKSVYSDISINSIPLTSLSTIGSLTNIIVSLDILNNATIRFTPPFIRTGVTVTYEFILYNTNTTVTTLKNIDDSNVTEFQVLLDSNIKYQLNSKTIYSTTNTLITRTFNSEIVEFNTRSPPTKFRINYIRDKSVEFGFSAPILLPDKYTLNIKNNSNISTSEKNINISNDSTSFYYDDLSSNTAYLFQLESVYNNIDVLKTPSLNSNTLGPILNPSFSSITSNSMVFSFTDSSILPQNGYDLTIKNQNPIETSENRTFSNISNPLLLSGLSSNNVYIITITSRFSVNNEEYDISSTSLIQSTQGSPSNITIHANKITDITADVSFALVNYNPEKYTYILTYNNGILYQQKNLNNNINTFTLNELLSNTNYLLRIFSVYSVDASYSTSTSFNTKGTVQNLQIIPSSTNIINGVYYNTVNVSFKNPLDFSMNPYKISVKNINSPYDVSNTTINVVRNPNQIYSIFYNKIQQNSKYLIDISSNYDNITLDISSIFLTQGPPVSFDVSNITNTTAEIYLKACTYPPDSYHMVVQLGIDAPFDIIFQNILSSVPSIQPTNIWNNSTYVQNIFISSDDRHAIMYYLDSTDNSFNYIISSDYGNTWSKNKTLLSPSLPILSEEKYTFYLNPNGNFLYNNSQGVFYSNDFGGKWEKSIFIDNVLRYNNTFVRFSVGIDTSYAIAMDISTNPLPIQYSSDCGKTWSLSSYTFYNNPMNNGNTNTIFMSDDALNSYIICTNLNRNSQFIIKSIDYGENWNVIYNVSIQNFPQKTIRGMSVSTYGNFLFFTQIDGNYLFSRNYGNSFQNLTINPFFINASIFNYSFSANGNYGMIVDQNTNFLYYSTNYGSTWLQSDISSSNLSLNMVKISNNNNYSIMTNYNKFNRVFIDTNTDNRLFYFKYNYLLPDLSYSFFLYSNYAINSQKYYTPIRTITTLSPPTDIIIINDFTSANISFTSPKNTIPNYYTVNITDNNNALFRSKKINELSIYVQGLKDNSTYYVVIYSNYNDISINSISTVLKTVNLPKFEVLSVSTQSNSRNTNKYTITSKYTVNKLPLFYYLRIIYPDEYNKTYVIDVNYFYFTNLTQVGNYIIFVKAVYENNITSESSNNIYVNNYTPVILNSVISSTDNSCNIIVNYQINDENSYNLYINNSISNYNFFIPDLSRNSNTYIFNGLILNSGSYDIYINTFSNETNNYTTKIIKYTLPNYTVPIMKILKITNDTSNSLIVNYYVQESYNTNYNIILQSDSFPEISYNIIVVSTNINTTRFSNLYYNSGKYNVYLHSNYNNTNISSSDISSGYLRIISPITFNSVDYTSNSNSLQINYTLYSTYKGQYYSKIKNRVFSEISGNVLLSKNSNIYIWKLPYYNLGNYDVILDMSYANSRYPNDTSFNIKKPTNNINYIFPISNFSLNTSTNSTQNNITANFNLLPTYDTSYILTATNRIYPNLKYITKNINSNTTSYTFPIPYYNSGEYVIDISLAYRGTKDSINKLTIIDVSSQSITLTNYPNPIIFGRVEKTDNSILLPFTLVPLYNSKYTLTLANKSIPELIYQTSIADSSTNYLFSDLKFNSGTYDISMMVIYNSIDTYFITQEISLNDVNPVSITGISNTENSITVKYNTKSVYNPTYTIYANNTTTPELDISYRVLNNTDISYTFSDLFYNSGSYNIYIYETYSNIRDFSTITQPINLPNIEPIRIFTIIPSYTSFIVNYYLNSVYKPTYILYANHINSALSFFSPFNTNRDNSFNFIIPNGYYNTGTYNIYIKVSYQNGNGNYETPIQSIELLNQKPITIQTLTTGVSNNLNTINIGYNYLPVYKPRYTLFAKNKVFDISYSQIFTPSVQSNQNTITIPGIYYNSGEYDISLSIAYLNKIDSDISKVTFIGTTLASIRSITTDISSINVTYQLFSAYKAIYRLIARPMDIDGEPITKYLYPENTNTDISGLFINSNRYDISLNVSYNLNNMFNIDSSAVLVYKTPIIISNIYSGTNYIDISFSLVPVSNPSYTILAINRLFPDLSYSYTFNNTRLMNYRFPLEYYSEYDEVYDISMTVYYNKNKRFTYNTVNTTNIIPTKTIATIDNITNTSNSITVNYSVLPLYNSKNILYLTHKTNPALDVSNIISQNSNTLIFNNLPYNSGINQTGGTYDLLLSVFYGTSYTYIISGSSITLPFYNYITNSDFSSPVVNNNFIYNELRPPTYWNCTTNNVLTFLNNGNNFYNFPKFIPNSQNNQIKNITNVVILQKNNTFLFQNIQNLIPATYSFQLYYVSNGQSTATISVSLGSKSIINIPITRLNTSWVSSILTSVNITDINNNLLKITLSTTNATVAIAALLLY